jgi:hypothetical protein
VILNCGAICLADSYTGLWEREYWRLSPSSNATSCTGRVEAGIAQARKEGRPHDRPPIVANYVPQVRSLACNGLSKARLPAACDQSNIGTQIPNGLG